MEGEASAIEQLEDGAAELDGGEIARAQDEPRAGLAAPPALARAVGVPGAGHAQVGVEAAPVVEVQEQVLAACAHRAQHAAVERGRQTDGRLARRASAP